MPNGSKKETIMTLANACKQISHSTILKPVSAAVIVALLTLNLIGCSALSSSPKTGGNGSGLNGSWIFTETDQTSGFGTFTETGSFQTSSANSVTGDLTCPDDCQNNNTYNVTGTASGTAFSITEQWERACNDLTTITDPYTYTGTIIGGSISGFYASAGAVCEDGTTFAGDSGIFVATPAAASAGASANRADRSASKHAHHSIPVTGGGLVRKNAKP
jgi:hypothetical protein